ncbi:MAG: UDP-N-acetylmuramoyl-tripeptide--D-alanyl-D-alanine ligase [Verrucomicrobia bacterium]|nr:UDP-N-acetylmuramoyl-tripeptide--D-alanyl-D-alanine ligase [Verrucomicrobiota bacterium]MDA1006315.1 UDP-N-acetylmuramoyl-tripeptide--D-alanyl-D-alanine ligase [Verrucomicrobiota bacterium]
MIACSIQTICDATGGTLMSGDGGRMVEAGVSTDTRHLPAGSLFIALEGERFDAHDFLAKAVEAGAAGVMVSRVPEGFEGGETAVIEVGSTLRGLQRLARWYRDELGIVVVAITGSNGKTTTKDFTASVLGQRFVVNATKGNLNNHIGVPLTILSTEEEAEVIVVEMGMNHPGEIAPLCEIARPHVGLITNIGTAHIEFMGSRDGIAEEKGALARSLPEVGTLLVTAGCDYASYFQERTLARTVTVGNGRGLVRAEGLSFDENGAHFNLVLEGQGQTPVTINVAGRHMVNNALLAAGAGMALRLRLEEIAAGLQTAEITGGRLKRFEADGITVFDDTYNANPDSVKAAIDVLAEQVTTNGNSKTVVLGMMAELGHFAEAMHKEVGRYAVGHGVRLVSVGAEAALIAEGGREVNAEAVTHFDDYKEAAAWLRKELHAGDFVLFKGSRMAAVETVMNEIFAKN